MAVAQPPVPTVDPSASASRFWQYLDRRVQGMLDDWINRILGVPRPRSMTMVIPLADVTGPLATSGWLQTVPIFTTCRITAWAIQSLSIGSVSLDIRWNLIPNGPNNGAITPTSMNGPSNFLQVTNGYSNLSFDTTAWVQRDIVASSAVSVYVNSMSGVTSAVLGLQLSDLQGRVLQI